MAYCNNQVFKKLLKHHIGLGGLIAYPTEAVWGLGCDPFNESALLQLLHLKQRPWHKGLILVTGDVNHVQRHLAALPSEAESLCRSLWPGHFTCLLPDIDEAFSPLLKGRHEKIAIRVSQHPFIQWYSRHISPFLVSTSANIAGKSPVRYSWQAHHHFKNDIGLVVPGKTLGELRPSTLIDPISQVKLRQ